MLSASGLTPPSTTHLSSEVTTTSSLPGHVRACQGVTHIFGGLTVRATGRPGLSRSALSKLSNKLSAVTPHDRLDVSPLGSFIGGALDGRRNAFRAPSRNLGARVGRGDIQIPADGRHPIRHVLESAP